jgi:hypothetical protein
MKNKSLILIALTGGLALAQNPTPAGTASQGPDAEIQMLRKDLRSARKQIVAINMNLSDAEAEKFWPVYDQFAAELTKINDAKAALIQEYAESAGAITDEQADQALQARAAIEEAVLKLKVKYMSAFRKVLSAKSTALFYQIDWQVGTMIDLQIASQLPLIEP